MSDQIIYVSPVDRVKKVKTPPSEADGQVFVLPVFDLPLAARLHEVGTALHHAGLCRLWSVLVTAESVGLRRGELMRHARHYLDFAAGVLHGRHSLIVTKGPAGLAI